MPKFFEEDQASPAVIASEDGLEWELKWNLDGMSFWHVFNPFTPVPTTCCFKRMMGCGVLQATSNVPSQCREDSLALALEKLQPCPVWTSQGLDVLCIHLAATCTACGRQRTACESGILIPDFLMTRWSVIYSTFGIRMVGWHYRLFGHHLQWVYFHSLCIPTCCLGFTEFVAPPFLQCRP